MPMKETEVSWQYPPITVGRGEASRASILQTDIELHFPQVFDSARKLNIAVVGAWRGDEIHAFLRWKNIGNVFAFEPHPGPFEYLHRAFKNNPNVHCYNVACGDSNGKTTLHVTASTGSDSLLPIQAGSETKEVGNIEIDVVTLDSFAPLKGVDIDLLWMDVQGFEKHVLEGASNLLGRTRAIYTEVNTDESTYAGAVVAKDLYDFLAQHGFAVACEEMDGVQGTAFFLKNNIKTDFFAESKIRERGLAIQRALSRYHMLTSGAVYRVLGKIVPTSIKARLKRFIK